MSISCCPCSQSWWSCHLQLCGHHKATLNSLLEVDQYPLPRLNKLLATLTGGRKFSKIDLTGAYQQLMLEENFLTVDYDQYLLWALSIYMPSIWSCITTSFFPEGDGRSAAGTSVSYLLFGWHLSLWYHWGGASLKPKRRTTRLQEYTFNIQARCDKCVFMVD